MLHNTIQPNQHRSVCSRLAHALFASVCSSVFLAACATHPFPLEQAASRLGLQKIENVAGQFPVTLFYRDQPGAQVVFIEGDGRPWTADGRQVSADPTPHKALAFSLMEQTPAAVIYITRPCYYRDADQTCNSRWWTTARYSEAVVHSMVTALQTTLDPLRRTMLVGHSGGGTLALLIAARLNQPVTVVTVAGLLDVNAWTLHHDYDPLSDSLNPADDARIGLIPQIHLAGGKDHVVPEAITEAATAQWPRAQVWRFPDFDHRCCWKRDWPAIWARLIAQPVE